MFKRPLVWILAAFILVCLLNTQTTHQMDTIFEDEIPGQVFGTVSQIVKKESGMSVYIKDVTMHPEDAGKYVCSKMLIYSSSNTNLKVGNQVRLSGTIMKFQRPTNPGQFNEAQYYKSNHVAYKMFADSIEITNPSYSKLYSILNNIRNKMIGTYNSMLSQEEAGIIDAMLLGDKTLLDTEVKELYQKSGISHALVISGMNISLIGLALYQVLIHLGVHRYITSCLTMILIFYYGMLTEFSVSTNRAVVMLMLSIVAGMIGRTYDLISATAFSALIILFQNPYQIFNAGFLLSFGAVIGIIYLVPAVRMLLPNKEKSKNMMSWVLQLLKDGFIISFCTNLITMPIIIYNFYEIPLYGVIINILLIPFLSILFVLSMIGGIIGCFIPPAGMFLMGGVHAILSYIEVICNLFSKLPYSTIIVGKPSIILVILYYFILILFVVLMRKYEKKLYGLLLGFLSILFLHIENHQLQFTILDVGQGDGIVVETPQEKIYLIDGGSSDVDQVGKYRIEPYLKYNGISTINGIIITHGDEDHISGIRQLMEEDHIKIKVLIVPDVPFEESNLEELTELAKSKRIEVISIKKGDVIRDNEVSITCLHPIANFRTESVNGYSTVLEFKYGTFEGLFVGDLEGDGEELVTNMEHLEQYDLLKVAHHGSKYSTSSRFLEKIKPKISVISCGKNNRYGHPHKELLERLNIVGSNNFITSKSGAVTIETDGKTMEISPYLKNSLPLTKLY